MSVPKSSPVRRSSAVGMDHTPQLPKPLTDFEGLSADDKRETQSFARLPKGEGIGTPKNHASVQDRKWRACR